MSIRVVAILVAAMAVGFLVLPQQAPMSEATASVEETADGRAAIGDTVLLHYTARTGDGEVFEKTDPGQPRGIELGSQQVLPALEQALIGIRAGETREVRIASDDAFGPYIDAPGMQTRMMRAALSHRLEPYVGMRLNAAVFPDEKSNEPTHVPVTVIQVTNDYLVVDANHPLAGKDLVFEVEAVEVIRPGE
jgi:peptidylprolyl isomerase